MPVRKPQDLHTRHSTRDEIAERAAQEASMQTKRGLPAEPARLKTHDSAMVVWRRLMREFDSIEAVLITRLDMDLLIDYCLLSEQVGELDLMRSVAYDTWLFMGKKLDEIKREANLEKIMAIQIASQVVDAFDAVVKLDARVDQKRKLLLQLRQSLYLTPRARAGAAPEGKTKEPPKDPMEELMDDALETAHRKVGGDE